MLVNKGISYNFTAKFAQFMSVKPSLPKGTRDFLPQAMLSREYIINTMRSVFKKYGFLPIETPAMENASTLTGKYGEEGDRLIFKIFPRGEKAKGNLEDIKPAEALRYDLTVPFARFVVQNQNELQLPFKRYQIQPVWRADKPQRGRYREFYQCDADAVGSASLLLELDFIRIYKEVFEKLGINITIKINNRKLLAGLAEVLNITERLTEFTVCLDKLDKKGVTGVIQELQSAGFDEKVINGLHDIVNLKGTNHEMLETVREMLLQSEVGLKGAEELQFVLNNVEEGTPLKMDLTLARGLDYYTGAIFEVVANDVELGSIGGGGRYDDLTGIFGLKNVSGIGISFGLDRIQLVLEELALLPELKKESTEVLFFNFGEKEALLSLKMVNKLRDAGIKAELYPDNAKFKKQINYTAKREIPFIALIEEEIPIDSPITFRNTGTREEERLTIDQLIAKLSTKNNL